MKITSLALTLFVATCGLSQSLISNVETTEGDVGELSADRPGFGIPTNVLPLGILQMESGVAYNAESAFGMRHHSVNWGSPLFRAGIGKGIELRFGGDGFINSRTACNGQVSRMIGWSDFAAGAKIALMDEHGWRPAISAIPAFSVPIGGRDVTNSAFDPNLTIAWSKKLDENWSSGGTVGYASITDQSHRFAQRAVTVSVGHALWAGLAGFVEAYNLSPIELGGRQAWMLDGGVTHALGRNAQWDFSTGRRFVGTTACWFASIGFVTRATQTGHLLSTLLHRPGR